MKTWTNRIAAAVTGVGVAAALALSAGVPAASAAPVSGKTTVTVGDNFYKPDDIEVTAGTKVTWVNKGKIIHTVTPDKGKAFGARLTKGKKYSYTFKKPGKYPYYCTLHGAPGSGQNGTITVVAAPTTTSTSAP